MKKAFLIGILCLALTGCSKNEEPFLIDNYLVIEESGYSQYGSVNVTLDYDKMYTDYKSVFKRYSVSQSALNKEQPIVLNYTDSNSLYNYKEIEIQLTDNPNSEIDIDKMFKTHTQKTLKRILTGFTPLEKYNPFDDLIVTKVGVSGEGYILAKILHYGVNGSWEWPVTVHSETATNNQTITLSIDNLDKDTIQNRFGIEITTTEHEYLVEDMWYKPEDSSVFQYISHDNLTSLNTIVEDWVISGQNDENQANSERTYEYEKAILFTNGTKSKIFFIYKIRDKIVPNGYYIYISPKDEVIIDPINNTLRTRNADNLSESFALYDKETIRYTEKWGWGQDDKPHGFMCQDFPYAGKMTLEEEVQYLINQYPEYTTLYHQ